VIKLNKKYVKCFFPAA